MCCSGIGVRKAKWQCCDRLDVSGQGWFGQEWMGVDVECIGRQDSET